MDKLDKIQQELQEFREESKVQFAIIVKDLAYHIKRTNLLEAKLEPVEKHVTFINTLLKVLLGLAAIVGTIAGMLRVFL